MNFLKNVERRGRLILVKLAGVFLSTPRCTICLGSNPRILVIRLDERLGNLLLLTPVLDSLRRRFAGAEIEVLANRRGRPILATHPSVNHFLTFAKWAIFSGEGPLGTVARLRRRHYDLVIDAANPTDPSTTQALLTRLCGARYTVGVDRPGFGRLYSSPVTIADTDRHEISLRLQLLSPVPGAEICDKMSIPKFSPSPRVRAFLATLPKDKIAVLNVGARLRAKQLSGEEFGRVVLSIVREGLIPVVVFGPGEEPVARALSAWSSQTRLAPPTDVADLAAVMSAAQAVVSCDTGPMHLAVALAKPTCGIFVNTDPTRFGYPHAPHLVIDARDRSVDGWLPDLRSWLANLHRYGGV